MKKRNRKKIEREIREIGKELLDIIKEEIFLCSTTADADRFERFLSLIDYHTSYEIVRTLRDKGFSKELMKLCDKAGKKEKTEIKWENDPLWLGLQNPPDWGVETDSSRLDEEFP